MIFSYFAVTRKLRWIGYRLPYVNELFSTNSRNDS